MPFTWEITIDKALGSPGFAYTPNTLSVALGDQVFWTNNDDVPHWPGAPGNPAYFMANQIAPNSPSTTFVPGATGTLSFSDSLANNDPGGTIDVS